MAIKAADILKPNGSFTIVEPEDIKIGDKNLVEYLHDISAGVGEKGDTGNGIASITKTDSSGTDPVVDTYTVTFTDGSTTTFNVTNGKKGEKGEKGDTGDVGPQGPVGATGPRGAEGPQGQAGEQGIQGIKGEKGDKGDKGEKGETGDAGAKGETGNSCHAKIEESTDVDGTKHVYLKVWDGEDESIATSSADLMGPTNEVLAAIDEIMGSYSSTTVTQTTE